MKLSNVVVMCLSALLGLLMVCFTVIACTMVVNWSAPEEAAILEGKVCSVQIFNTDYDSQPLADGSAPDFLDMDPNADFDLVIDGMPNTSNVVGVWFFPAVLPDTDFSDSPRFGFRVYGSAASYVGFSFRRSYVAYINSDETVYLSVYSYSGAGWGSVSYRLVYIHSVWSDIDTILDRFSLLGAVKVSDDLDYTPVVYVPPDYVQPVTEVFDGLGVWLIAGLNNVIALFWVADTGSLTLLGVLAVAALAVSVFFLLVGIIQNFLHFRG